MLALRLSCCAAVQLIDGETGLLVAPGDHAGLSEALRTLAADPSLAKSYSDDGYPAVGLAIFFRHPAIARHLVEL